jgi:hypothetical protein
MQAERFETIPYRPSEYSEACRSFIDDPLYKVTSVLLIVAAGVREKHTYTAHTPFI